MRKNIEVYKFYYRPLPELSGMLNGLIMNFNYGIIEGILAKNLVSIAKSLKLYCVCGIFIHPESKEEFYKDPLAVAARSDVEACSIYADWKDMDGHVVGVLEQSMDGVKLLTTE